MKVNLPHEISFKMLTNQDVRDITAVNQGKLKHHLVVRDGKLLLVDNSAALWWFQRIFRYFWKPTEERLSTVCAKMAELYQAEVIDTLSNQDSNSANTSITRHCSHAYMAVLIDLFNERILNKRNAIRSRLKPIKRLKHSQELVEKSTQPIILEIMLQNVKDHHIKQLQSAAEFSASPEPSPFSRLMLEPLQLLIAFKELETHLDLMKYKSHAARYKLPNLAEKTLSLITKYSELCYSDINDKKLKLIERLNLYNELLQVIKLNEIMEGDQEERLENFMQVLKDAIDNTQLSYFLDGDVLGVKLINYLEKRFENEGLELSQEFNQAMLQPNDKLISQAKRLWNLYTFWNNELLLPFYNKFHFPYDLSRQLKQNLMLLKPLANYEDGVQIPNNPGIKRCFKKYMAWKKDLDQGQNPKCVNERRI